LQQQNPEVNANQLNFPFPVIYPEEPPLKLNDPNCQTKKKRGRPKKKLNIVIDQIVKTENEIKVEKTFALKRNLKRLKQNLSACICRRKQQEGAQKIEDLLKELEDENCLLQSISEKYQKKIKNLEKKLKLNYWRNHVKSSFL
jgi:hypothetical protein